MNRNQSARDFVTVHARAHIPSNARNIQWRFIDDSQAVGTFGHRIDPRPAEGLVVGCDEQWLLIKTGRVEFVAAHCSIFSPTTDMAWYLGAKIALTPYARRQFNGERLDAPKVEARDYGGVVYNVSVMTIGDSRTRFPFSNVKTPELKDLLEQMEVLCTPDGFRTTAQVLVDAGATNLRINDPGLGADIVADPVWFSSDVATAKFSGTIVVEYDRPGDHFKVILRTGETEIGTVEPVFFDSLAGTIVDLIDDGAWRWATITVLKAAPRKRAA